MKSDLNNLRDNGVVPDELDRGVEVAGISEYDDAELIRLGTCKSLIQGYWTEGWADWATGYKHNE
jgi:hypothetical protein